MPKNKNSSQLKSRDDIFKKIKNNKKVAKDEN